MVLMYSGVESTMLLCVIIDCSKKSGAYKDVSLYRKYIKRWDIGEVWQGGLSSSHIKTIYHGQNSLH